MTHPQALQQPPRKGVQQDQVHTTGDPRTCAETGRPRSGPRILPPTQVEQDADLIRNGVLIQVPQDHHRDRPQRLSGRESPVHELKELGLGRSRAVRGAVDVKIVNGQPPPCEVRKVHGAPPRRAGGVIDDQPPGPIFDGRGHQGNPRRVFPPHRSE